jgi:hypothetical protein
VYHRRILNITLQNHKARTYLFLPDVLEFVDNNIVWNSDVHTAWRHWHKVLHACVEDKINGYMIMLGGTRTLGVGKGWDLGLVSQRKTFVRDMHIPRISRIGSYTRLKIITCSRLLKTGCNNVVLPTLFIVVNNIVQHCWTWISPQSGVTMLLNFSTVGLYMP